MFVFITSVSADDFVEEGISEDLGVSELFANFLDESFSHIDDLIVEDSNGVEITKHFIDVASTYYAENDYVSIQDMIKNENLTVSYKVVSNITPKGNFAPMSNIRSKSVSQNFYHIASDKGITKEWTTKLYGTFSYDINTYNITSASNPTFTLLNANFGTAFSPVVKSVSTSRTISGRSVTFNASHRMMATLVLPIIGIPIGTEYDFGTHRTSASGSSM